MSSSPYDRLRRGLVIPALPLALDADRRWDERRQRGLLRYYRAAGAGGLAVGVHTTQFAIREPSVGLFGPLLALAAEEMAKGGPLFVRIAGACGPTRQAAAEATLARDLGYHAVLLSLAALRDADDDALIAHCRVVADVLPVIGFYLQPDVGGRDLSHAFWRRFAEIDRVVAIKVAPFDRYKTIDVVRAVAESGRTGLALYTGNDDHIVLDLLTPFRSGGAERRFAGGLLGQWAVWTRGAVALLDRCRALAESRAPASAELLGLANALTDANAAIFDAANGFAGCVAGIHEILRRQGLLEGTWCLDPWEGLGPGQIAEIDRVLAAYQELAAEDDAFIREHRDEWLSG